MRRTASASAERPPCLVCAVELAYRQLTMGWVLRFLPSSKAFLRIIVALLASLAYLIATVAIRPYRRLEDNALAVASSTVLVILFMGCALIKAYEDFDEATTLLGDSQLASRMLGFSSTSEIVALLLKLFPHAIDALGQRWVGRQEPFGPTTQPTKPTARSGPLPTTKRSTNTSPSMMTAASSSPQTRNNTSRR